jgi:hypothetical protein
VPATLLARADEVIDYFTEISLQNGPYQGI